MGVSITFLLSVVFDPTNLEDLCLAKDTLDFIHGHLRENEIAYLMGEIELEEAAEKSGCSCEGFRRNLDRRKAERHESRGLLMRRSSARENQRLTEGAPILKSPLQYRNYKFFIQLDRPVERKAGIATCFSLGQFEVHQVTASIITPSLDSHESLIS